MRIPMNIRSLLAVGAIVLPAVFLPLSHSDAAREGRAQSIRFAFPAEQSFAQRPPAPWADADPADSLYSAGREAINHGDFRRAASLFAEISAKYPRSEYAPDAPYWRAFALYKV